MLKINGIPPVLINRVCEQLICQQYWYRGHLAQEVDILFLKVSGRWQQLYFDAGIVFWRNQLHQPQPVEQLVDSPFAYPLIDIGEQFALNGCTITDCITEALVDGARLTLVFEDRGTLFITHNDNRSRLQFNPS